MRSSLFLFLLLMACQQNHPDTRKGEVEGSIRHVPAFQQIIDSSLVNGVILVYDQKAAIYYTNDEKAINRATLPASTFKIPNSVIALETGVVKDTSTLFEWDGEDRNLDIWERDMVLKEAFHLSCVPCYQQVARSIGPQRMNKYLKLFQYGDMRVDSSNIDLFWLEGASKITPLEQIEFLQKLYFSNLPVSERTSRMMKDLMIIEETANYRLSGKTGWAIREGKNIGWFVGYLEKEEQLYFFATRVEPEAAFDMSNFARIRKEITWQGFNAIGLLE